MDGTLATEPGFSWCAGAIGHGSPETVRAIAALASETLTTGDGEVALLGSWRAGEVRTLSVGPVWAAFVGITRFSDDEALAEVRRAGHRARLDALARLPGSFQLVVWSPSGVSLFADSIGLRRFWHVRTGGCLLFATHALLLHRLAGSQVDDDWLATRLAAPSLRGALERRAPFVGVEGVAPGESVHIRRDGSVRTERWWIPPEPNMPLAGAATALSERLSSAVGHRVAAVRRASCDVSGGLDSTSLAFLAAAAAGSRHTPLVTVTRVPASPANDDRAWSAKALDALSSGEHVRLDVEEQWLPYSRLSVPPALDEPDPSTVLLGPMRQLAGVLARIGSEVHLAGNGGDPVLGAPMAYLGGLARRHPVLALRHLRGHRALSGLTGRSVTEFARPSRYADWLALAAQRVEEGGRIPHTWALPPSSPTGLLTRDSLAAARLVLLEAAGQVEQVGGIERHGAVVRIRHCAAVQRLHRDVAASLGYRLELPFLDADVVEVCLSARPHERLDPYRPKPLLVAAMRGTVPDALLDRTTMGVYETELHLGWRRHRDEMRRWLDGSRLVDRGLVTGPGLDAVFDRRLDTAGLLALNEVLAAELWLRSLESLPVGPMRRAAAHHAQDAGRH